MEVKDTTLTLKDAKDTLKSTDFSSLKDTGGGVPIPTGADDYLEIISSPDSPPFYDTGELWDYTNDTLSDTKPINYTVSAVIEGGQDYYIAVDINPYNIDNFPFEIGSAALPANAELYKVTKESNSERAVYKVNSPAVDTVSISFDISVVLKDDEDYTYYVDTDGTVAAAIGNALLSAENVKFGVGVKVSNTVAIELGSTIKESDYTIIKEHKLYFGKSSDGSLQEVISKEAFITPSIVDKNNQKVDFALQDLYLLPDGNVYFSSDGKVFSIDDYFYKLDLANDNHYAVGDFTLNLNLPENFEQRDLFDDSLGSKSTYKYGMNYGNDYIMNTTVPNSNNINSSSLSVNETHFFEGSMGANGIIENDIYVARTLSTSTGNYNITAINTLDTYTDSSYEATEESSVTYTQYHDNGTISHEEYKLGKVKINIPELTYVDRMSSTVSLPITVNSDTPADTEFKFEIEGELSSDDLTNLNALESYPNGVMTFRIPSAFDATKISLNYASNYFTGYSLGSDETGTTNEITSSEIDITGNNLIHFKIKDTGFIHTSNPSKQLLSGYFKGTFTDPGADSYIKVEIDIKSATRDEIAIEDRIVRENVDGGKRSIDLVWTYGAAVDNLDVSITSSSSHTGIESNPLHLSDSTGFLRALIFLDRKDHNTDEYDDENLQSINYENLTFTITTEKEAQMQLIESITFYFGGTESWLNSFRRNYTITTVPYIEYTTVENPHEIIKHDIVNQNPGSVTVNKPTTGTFSLPDGEHFATLKIVVPEVLLNASTMSDNIFNLHFSSERIDENKWGTITEDSTYRSELNVSVTSESFYPEHDNPRTSMYPYFYKYDSTQKVNTSSIVTPTGTTSENSSISLPKDVDEFGLTISNIKLRDVSYLRDGTSIYFDLNDEYFQYVGKSPHITPITIGDNDVWLRYELYKINLYDTDIIDVSSDSLELWFDFPEDAFIAKPNSSTVGSDAHELFKETLLDVGPTIITPIEENDYISIAVNDRLTVLEDVNGLTTSSDETFGYGIEPNVIPDSRMVVIELKPLVSVNRASASGVLVRPGVEAEEDVSLGSSDVEYVAYEHDDLMLNLALTKIAGDSISVTVTIPDGEDELIKLKLEEFITAPVGWSITYKDAAGESTTDASRVKTIEISSTNPDYQLDTLQFPLVADTVDIYDNDTAIDGTVTTVQTDVTINTAPQYSVDTRFTFKWYEMAGIVFVEDKYNIPDGIFEQGSYLFANFDPDTLEAFYENYATEIFRFSPPRERVNDFAELINIGSNPEFVVRNDTWFVDKDGDTYLPNYEVQGSAGNGKYTVAIPPKIDNYELTFNLSELSNKYAITTLPTGGDLNSNNNHPRTEGIKILANAETFSVVPNVDGENTQNLTQYELDNGLVDIGIYRQPTISVNDVSVKEKQTAEATVELKGTGSFTKGEEYIPVNEGYISQVGDVVVVDDNHVIVTVRGDVLTSTNYMATSTGTNYFGETITAIGKYNVYTTPYVHFHDTSTYDIRGTWDSGETDNKIRVYLSEKTTLIASVIEGTPPVIIAPDGYSVDGWVYEDDEGKLARYSVSRSLFHLTDIYPLFLADETPVTITFDMLGKSVITAGETDKGIKYEIVDGGKQATVNILPLSNDELDRRVDIDDVKPGYDLKGWFIDENNNDIYDVGIDIFYETRDIDEYIIVEDITFKAYYEFEGNIATFEVYDPVNTDNIYDKEVVDVPISDELTAPDNTLFDVPEGYEITAWYDKDDPDKVHITNFTDDFNEVTPRVDKTYIAVLTEKTYTVIFKHDVDSVDTIEEYNDVEHNSTIRETVLYNIPDDKVLLGWTTDSNPGEDSILWNFDDGTNTDTDTKVIGDTTLYPVLSDKVIVSVTYNKALDDTDDTLESIIGDLTPGTIITVENTGGTNPDFDGDVIITLDTIVPDPVKENYIFTGYVQTTDLEGKHTIIATWKAVDETVDVTFNKYTDGTDKTTPSSITKLPIETIITVNNTGGTNPDFDGEVTITVDTIIPDPVKENYIFTGYVQTTDLEGKHTITATWIMLEVEELPAVIPEDETIDSPKTGDSSSYIVFQIYMFTMLIIGLFVVFKKHTNQE